MQFGRQIIYTPYNEIDDSNILDILDNAIQIHEQNLSDIVYLYDYYKGDQPEAKKKGENLTPVVENRANEIVSFKVGYLMGEPVQYVSRNDDDKAINVLNDYMFAEDKAAKDKELAKWSAICGTSYRMILPDIGDVDESPFEIYTLDPRSTFVVRWSGLGNPVVMAVTYVENTDGDTVYSVYTRDRYYEVIDDEIVKREANGIGMIPIIEYPENYERQGAFEIVLSLLDAINELSTNRTRAIQKFVDAIMVFQGVDIEDEKFQQLKEQGAVSIPEGTDIKYIVQELNQSQTQTLADYMYQTVLTICGMPNRNGGTSTSDTGSAVILRDGWQLAEARAKDRETTFKENEKEFLRVVLHITNTLRGMDLRLANVEIRFTRRNYENIQEKAQVLISMLNNDKIHPLLAFEHSGMFSDPNLAYTISEKYFTEEVEKQEKELEAFAAAAKEETIEETEEVIADV